MATHSSILTWRVPWTEEPGGLQSMGSQKSRGHDLTTKQQQPNTVSSTFPSVGNFEMNVPECILWALFFFFALGYISRPEVLGLKKYMSSKDLDIY